MDDAEACFILSSRNEVDRTAAVSLINWILIVGETQSHDNNDLDEAISPPFIIQPRAFEIFVIRES